MGEILSKLEEERVFSIQVSDDKKKIMFMEECDACFFHSLNKSEALKLIDELKEVVSGMVY